MRRLALFVALFAFVAPVLAACSGEDGTTSIPNSSRGAESSATNDGGSSSRADASPPAASDAGTTTTPPGGEDDPVANGPEQSGEATYYDANGTGACGFKPSNDFYVAAMNDEQYRQADCGKCVSVTGPKGTTVVRIVDKCPGCDRGDLDLSMTAFSKVASLSDGRIKIKWHFVACP